MSPWHLGGGESWRGWLAPKFVGPIICALILAGGGVAGTEIDTHTHHCEAEVVHIVSSTRAANGKISRSNTTETTSCPKR